MQTIPVQFEELRTSQDLPSPAGVGMKILEITSTDEYSVEDMGDAIMSDPSLTGRILELANSAERAGQEPITTVSAAIMRLGATMVRNLALAFSLVSEREVGACRPFEYDKYWSQSLARAVAAKALSARTGIQTPEESYVAGLLGDVGALALASVHSERYGRVLVQCQGLNREALREAERAEFDIDHAVVTRCMMLDWGLPEAFSELVTAFSMKRVHSDDDVTLQSLTDILIFADTIGRALLMESEPSAIAKAEIGDQLEQLRDILGLDESKLMVFCDQVAREWRIWGEKLEIETNEIRFSQVFSEIAAARDAAEAEIRDAAQASLESVASEVASPTPGASPEETAALQAVVEAAEDARRIASERISILAVDDDPVSLRLLVRHLIRDRFDVSMARAGKEGLRRALQDKPDLLVIDYEMPDMSGLDVVRALRRSSIGNNMYIVLVTGNEDEEVLLEAFNSGVDDFVSKPFRPRLLAARIKAGVRIANLTRKVETDRRTILSQLAEKSALNRKLRTASLTDPLTGLPNRRHAMNRVETEWASSERTGTPFSVIMLDIDHFKSVNDNHGHDVGDVVLQETAKAVKGALRGEDEVCRLGGEEFLVICRNADESDGMAVAERIRKAVADNVVNEPGFERAVTVSLGVATYAPGLVSLMALLKASDEAVYIAKESGRNCVKRFDVPAAADAPAAERRSA